MINQKTWHNRSRIYTVAAAVTAVLLAAQASADPQLEEIVVTAQKRSQNLLEVPVAVTAVTGETLQNAGIESVAQLEFYAPSLVVAENSGGGMVATALVTRGIGVNGNIPYFEPSTALFIDGAYRSRSALGIGDLVAIDRIEYLRGPQSTLYGRNASAGVLSVYTPRPRSEWGGFVEATGAVEDVGERPFGYLVKGDVSGPVTDTVGVGASFTYSSSDDLFGVTGNQRIDSVNGFDDYSLRGQVEWQPTDAVNFRLSGGVVDRDHNGPATELFFADDAFAGLFPLLEGINDGLRARQGGADLGPSNDLLDQLLAAGAVPTAPGVTVTPPHNSIWDRRIHMDGVKRDTLEGSDVIGDLAIDIGDSMVLNSITSYNEYSSFDRQDIDQLTMPIGQFEEFQDGDAFSQELRLSSTGEGPLEWIVGAFYLQDHLERQVEFQLGPNAILLGVGLDGDTGRFNGELDTTSFSVFGNIGYEFTDALKVNAGIRWIDEKKEGEKINSSYNGAGPASPVFLNGGFAAIFEPSDSGEDDLSTNDFTYSLSLQYDLNENLMLYGSHARGFKSGGFNIVWGPIGPGEDGFEFDDETVYAYELGLKGTAADGAVQFSTAAFYQNHENYQTAAFMGTIFNLSNADQASTQGVEVELVWQALESLRLGANLAFVDAKYDDFKNGPCNSLSTPDANGYCDQSGYQLPFVSEWTANLSAEYVQPLLSGNLRLRADLALADGYNPDLVLAPYYEQDGYERLNLRAGWESERFDVTGFISNVTDAEIVDWAGAANVVPGASGQFVIQAGRTYGLTLRLKF